jgi:uncharacterized membrane protein
MSFFDSFFNSNNNSTTNNDLIVLTAGTERVEVFASDAKGKTVAQLFQENADALGIDADRINRYVDAGRIVTSDTPVEAGRQYSGNTTAESKG